MGKVIAHPSIEGAQHGPKGLAGFLDFAKEHGAAGAQPSNFMLEGPAGNLLPAADILAAFEQRGLHLDGVSAHCPFWVHTSAWTGTRGIRPFIPPDVARLSTDQITDWAETYILKLLDLCAELRVRVVPMFWGVAYGLELASGYPWGFWSYDSGGKAPDLDYDLLAEGDDRFVKMTAKIRAHANSLKLYLAHEIHPGTAACCADDFLRLVEICDYDRCLAVNADPSHCWEGEDELTRHKKVGALIYGYHAKNRRIIPGMPLRSMAPNWPDRAMQFTPLDQGGIDLPAFTELMIRVGYFDRYREMYGTDTAPIVSEAEAAHADLDYTAANGIAYVRDHLCFPVATGSFEDGMGAVDAEA